MRVLGEVTPVVAGAVRWHSPLLTTTITAVARNGRIDDDAECRATAKTFQKCRDRTALSKRLVVPLKVLFIGNSFTQRNNLPGLIANLASARGREMQHQLITAGGASLRRHWNAGQARTAISEGHYDFVVLQEQSTLPIKNATRMHESVRLFDEVIQEAGSKTVLYMTWARQHAPESQQDIAKAYASIGRELGALVVPVGPIWQSFIRNHDQPVLYVRDQSHPTLAGSYLAACVFVAAMLKENPVGIVADISGLDDEAQILLQKAAWRECKPKGRGK